MLSGTARSPATATVPMLDTVRIEFDWPQVFQSRVRERPLDDADTGGDPEKELAILMGTTAGPYERAIQALRDVRHLLPPEGVAIIDAALK
jgi:hypothetical protein